VKMCIFTREESRDSYIHLKDTFRAKKDIHKNLCLVHNILALLKQNKTLKDGRFTQSELPKLTHNKIILICNKSDV